MSPNIIYDLSGIILHSGNHKGGHFYVWVRGFENGRGWYKCDDQIISKIGDIKWVLGK